MTLGALVGALLFATPASAHFAPSISHIWFHIKKLADPRYANAVPGTDKAKNADKLDGHNSQEFINRSASSGADEQNATPVVLTEYSTWTDVLTVNLTTQGASSKVLIVGQFTAQNTSSNSGDIFGQVLVDGVKSDGNYWTDLGSAAPPVFARGQLSVSRVVTLGPGAHTIILQGSYYDGGTDRNVSAYARALSAVELD